MPNQSTLRVLFAGFGILMMALLAGDFAARNWQPEIELRWGWIVYAMGIPGLALAILFLRANDVPAIFPAGALVFTAWALFGFIVDRVLEIEWRAPILPAVFYPYVVLYVVWQILFWIPMWSIGRLYWTFYTLLFITATWLNLRTHR